MSFAGLYTFAGTSIPPVQTTSFRPVPHSSDEALMTPRTERWALLSHLMIVTLLLAWEFRVYQLRKLADL